MEARLHHDLAAEFGSINHMMLIFAVTKKCKSEVVMEVFKAAEARQHVEESDSNQGNPEKSL